MITELPLGFDVVESSRTLLKDDTENNPIPYLMSQTDRFLHRLVPLESFVKDSGSTFTQALS